MLLYLFTACKKLLMSYLDMPEIRVRLLMRNVLGRDVGAKEQRNGNGLAPHTMRRETCVIMAHVYDAGYCWIDLVR